MEVAKTFENKLLKVPERNCSNFNGKAEYTIEDKWLKLAERNCTDFLGKIFRNFPR